MIPVKLIQRIQDSLSPDLIDLHWQGQARENPLHGYCYISSEALYHLWARSAGFKPAQLWVHTGHGRKYSHWFLRRDGEILDITAAQFGRGHIAYSKAHGCGFLTKQPSNAAKEIIRRVGYEPGKAACSIACIECRKAWRQVHPVPDFVVFRYQRFLDRFQCV